MHDNTVDATEASLKAVRAYTPLALRFYDILTYGFTVPVLWKCPGSELLAHYNRHVSGNHLDVGVGTGYLLNQCHFPTATPRLFLLDLSPNSLAATAHRLRRYHPQTLRRDVLKPIQFDGARFDSIGTNHMIHCVPGSIPEKAVLFDHLGALLAPSGVIFGCTLLGQGAEPSRAAQWTLELVNKQGGFSNLRDNVDDLRRALEERFTDVSVRVVGITAIFSARKRADAPSPPKAG